MWKNVCVFGGLFIVGAVVAVFSSDLTGQTSKQEKSSDRIRVFNVPDDNGNNLFVQGTEGHDFTKIYETKGDLCVVVAGVEVNVTKETGIKAGEFYSIGIVGLGGDTVNIDELGSFPGGILKDGKVLVNGTDKESDSNREWNVPFNKRPSESDFGEIEPAGDKI